MKYILSFIILGSLLTNTSAQSYMTMAELSEMTERTQDFNTAVDAYIDGQDEYTSRKGVMRGMTNLSAAMYNFNNTLEHYSNPDNLNEKDASWTEQRIKDGAFLLNFTRSGKKNFSDRVSELMRIKTFFKNLRYRFDTSNPAHVLELKNFKEALNYCLNAQTEFSKTASE